MSTLLDLTLRTVTAVARLGELQQRLDRPREKPSSVTKTAIHELSTALEELESRRSRRA